MMATALPCPFCGTTPVIERWHGGPKRKHRVGCDNDHCHALPGTIGSTKAEAVTRWNARSVNAALDFIAERRAAMGEGR